MNLFSQGIKINKRTWKNLILNANSQISPLKDEIETLLFLNDKYCYLLNSYLSSKRNQKNELEIRDSLLYSFSRSS